MLLIISQSKKNARTIADTFYYMGILAYAATPHEALSEVSNLYRAVLILSPNTFPDIVDYVNRIKSYKRDLPIFSLTSTDPASFFPDVFDCCFSMQTLTPELAERIIDYANTSNKARIGDYFLAGFDASSHNVGVNYFYEKLPLTRTESMILRLLIRKYPIPTSCDEIVKYAFRASDAPQPTSIRTHISMMNKKLEKVIKRRMLSFVPRRGYVIVTPEFDKLFGINVK